MKKRTQILVTLLGGWFGLHKYLSGKIGMGILYTCTLGLFYIGWIHDCVKVFKAPSEQELSYLLRWQELVSPNIVSDKLVLSRKQLICASEMMEMNCQRILNDCYNLIHTTCNPEVFFKRYDLAIENSFDLCELNEFYPITPNPNQQYEELLSNKTELTNAFLIRAWNTTKEKALELKTEKARLNRYLKFKESVMPYLNDMTQESRNLFQNLN